MIWHDVEQNSEEWYALRCGKFTASSFSELLSAKSTLGYKKLINHVVFERLTGEKPESYHSTFMDRGHEIEPIAAEHYEMQTFLETKPGGFFEYDDYTGCSPDRIVGEDGLLEIKSPIPNTMIEYLKTGKLPSIYVDQVQGQLMITGRKWCDFIAFHPLLKPLIIRVYPDPVKIAAIKLELGIAIKTVNEIIEKIK